MATSLIALGGNVGDSTAIFNEAISRISRTRGTRVEACSSQCRSKPAGGPAGQAEYWNSAARLETSRTAVELLEELQAVESSLGRRRDVRWGPRTIDLDLLLYEEEIITSSRLMVPHPRMAFRRFVLKGAAEIAAEMHHPLCGATVEQLWRRLNETPRYIAVAGEERLEKTRFLQQFMQGAAARLVSSADLASADTDEQNLPSTVAQRLRDEVERASPAEWVISSFWLKDRAHGIQTGYQRATGPQPRLVISLDRQTGERIDAVGPHASASLRHYRGPLLNLNPQDAAESAAEAAAALSAMDESAA